jgi:hypothetical protein
MKEQQKPTFSGDEVSGSYAMTARVVHLLR